MIKKVYKSIKRLKRRRIDQPQIIILVDYFTYFLSIKIFCQSEPHDSYKNNFYKKKVCIMNLNGCELKFHIFKQNRKNNKKTQILFLPRSIALPS